MIRSGAARDALVERALRGTEYEGILAEHARKAQRPPLATDGPNRPRFVAEAHATQRLPAQRDEETNRREHHDDLNRLMAAFATLERDVGGGNSQEPILGSHQRLYAALACLQLLFATVAR